MVELSKKLRPKTHTSKTFQLDKASMGSNPGKIPGTGVYRLNEGEYVVPAKKVRAAERKAKRGISRTAGRR